jgi:hypothetical protein
VLTLLTALTLLIGISFDILTTLFFTNRVFMISAYILVLNYHNNQENAGITLER